MTWHEKRLNKVDLVTYKNLGDQYNAVLPGRHHYQTVASVPLAHTAAPEMDLE
jgi:hypothetical protein